MITSDEAGMEAALVCAKAAGQAGEVPVGAVLVHNQAIVAEGQNAMIQRCDPSAHAEIEALRAAGQVFSNYRLLDTTLYVTLEPCLMCLGALEHARIGRLVFGAFDPKTGAVASRYALANREGLNHQIAIQGGVLAEPCSALLKAFFRARR